MTSARTETSTTAMAQLDDFRVRCEELTGLDLASTTALHTFSVERYRDFWHTFLDWSGLAWEGDSTVVSTGDDVRHACFFPQVRLSYAENLLRPLADAPDDAPALTSVHADGTADRFTRGELRAEVRRTAEALAGLGITAGDRVVMIAPNKAGTVVAALAVAALGAALATATPDMGPSALLGRFTPVRPVAVLVDRTGMGGPVGGSDEVLAEVLAGLPTVRHVLLLDDGPRPGSGADVLRLAELTASVQADTARPWQRFPFDHPLWVMFSSGTTGPPKAMVHGAGGSLLEHVKEHRLHGDLRAADTLYFHTTTAWMMWNWQLSALAVGAHVVLYDGPITGPETLWELVAAHGATVFGTSPAYLQLCQDEQYTPREAVDLRRLRAVLSTGAVLHDWQFDWVTRAVGDVPLQSISGGTDIIGCFVLGHPHEHVRTGRCQSLGLGLDVAALDDGGLPVLDEVGELVCRRPFPSRPIGFLDDPGGRRFTEAYFSQNPGVWTHGDLIEIGTDGSARMHGRSDGVLNIDGVRIGPAEIYRILRQLPEVAGAMAVEQRRPDTPGATRLVLMVVLTSGAELDDALRRRIRVLLRREGSAAHVPAVVLQVRELPMTHNGKLSERAARDVLNGDPVRNLAALKNPQSLADLAELAAADQAAADRPAGGTDTGTDRAATPAAELPGITAVVRAAFHDTLGVAVPDTADFFDEGGSSRQSMRLLRRLRADVGRPLGMTTFLADPSIAGVSAAMAATDSTASPVEVLRQGDASGAPLYLVHGVHGDVDIYRSLVDSLSVPGPVYGLTRSVEDVGGAATTVAEIAAGHVATLTETRPTGPLCLAGYSFGGLVAYEIARQLAEQGREVALLALIDVHPPFEHLPRPSRVLYRTAARAANLVPGMTRVPLRTVLRGRFRPDTVAPDRRYMMSARSVFHGFRLGDYAGPVTFFRARYSIPVFMHLLYEWRRHAPGLTVVGVPGAHHDVLAPPHVWVLAGRLSQSVRTATAVRRR